MTSLGFLTFSSLKLHRFGQSLNTNPKPKVLNTLCLTHASSQTHCFTHARLSHLTQLKLMPHGLWISESHNFFFFSFSPSQHLNFNSTFASNLPHYFFFSFYLLTLTASRSRSRPLCFALYFSASSGIDSFLLIFILITWFSFFHLIIFSVFFIFYFLLHLRFSVHVLGFISGSLFRDFTGKW